MRVDAFDFELPDEAIALRPARPRDSARLLQVRPGPAGEASFDDLLVRDLPGLLRPGDALVVNDTEVVAARLRGERRRGGALAHIEFLLHRREAADVWRTLAKPARRLAPGERVEFKDARGDAQLRAEIVAKEGGDVLLRFDRSGRELDAALSALGRMPLPPYIESRRPVDAKDADDYQTLFAARSGAVAAPTAGLHFTPALLAALDAGGMELHRITLHVGLGTFLPIKAEATEDHVMHAERGRIGADTAEGLNRVRARGGRIVAVGTTSMRVLESAADAAGTLQPFDGETSIFITPGYRFRAVDALMTNFHLPRSTLFMLVSAFSGLQTMQRAYAHAIAVGYRFYSYGDASLLWRATEASGAGAGAR